MVRCINTKGTRDAYGEATEKGYYEKLSRAYKKVMKGREARSYVVVDCANGVGGGKLRELVKYLPSPKEGGVDIKIVNDDISAPERLNYQVGVAKRFFWTMNIPSELFPVWSRLCQNPTASTTILSGKVFGTLCVTGRRCGSSCVLLHRFRYPVPLAGRGQDRYTCRIIYRRTCPNGWDLGSS